MSLLNSYCYKWNLSDQKLIVSTHTSDVFKALFNGEVAVLKIFNEKGKEFEVKGSAVLNCFAGKGAVRLFNADGGAHLLEYVDGRDLKTLIAEGKDDLATEITAEILNKIHSYSGPIPDTLISMERYFEGLFEKAKTEPLDSIYVEGAKLAEKLIASAPEVRVLHGDLHHENILESSSRGWLAIDTQSLSGERTLDAANTFYNPKGYVPLAKSIDTIEKRSQIFSKKLQIDRRRILEYAFAYGCLSAAWYFSDNNEKEGTAELEIAQSVRKVLKGL